MAKRGIMVNFLVTVLIAIFIFVPACTITSKLFFRLSDQAQDNFRIFVTQLQEFSASGRTDLQDDFILIMNSDTSIQVHVNRSRAFLYSTTLYGTDEQLSTTTITQYYSSFPEAECTTLPCACLCRAFNHDNTNTFNSKSDISFTSATYAFEVELQCRALSCQVLDIPLKESWSIYREEEEGRRSLIHFIRDGNSVKIEG